MSVTSDNLATLRAYPLDVPGSAAMDNVAKLRVLDPSTMLTNSRRLIINATAMGGNVVHRSTPRLLIGATITIS